MAPPRVDIGVSGPGRLGRGTLSAPGFPDVDFDGVVVWPPPRILVQEFRLLGRELSTFHEPLEHFVRFVAVPDIRRNFLTRSYVEGGTVRKWVPLAPSTKKRRQFPNKPILQQTHTLMRAATAYDAWIIDGSRGRAHFNANYLFDKTPARPPVTDKNKGLVKSYALMHQLGSLGVGFRAENIRRKRTGEITVFRPEAGTKGFSKEIPPRPFVGFRANADARAEDIFYSWVERRIRSKKFIGEGTAFTARAGFIKV